MIKLILFLMIIPHSMLCQEIEDTTVLPYDSTFNSENAAKNDSTEISNKADNDSLFKKIEENFKTFQYNEVINDASEILKSDTSLTEKQKIELYRMKAISHFSLLEDKSAEKSIIEILKTDSTYSLDPIHTSPKIISFFDSIKVEYFRNNLEEAKTGTKQDTIYIVQRIPDYSSQHQFNKVVFRSILLPGLGHLYYGDNLKGSILTGLSALSLASMIYFIIDTNKKEKSYLEAKEKSVIPDLYDKYNKSYKMRNLSIIFYSVLWLYAQTDLLLFSHQKIPPVSINLSRNYIQMNVTILL